MRNNHFFKTQIVLAALAAVIIAPICAFSQQKTTVKPIKDSDIYVPDSALEPSCTRQQVSEDLREYINSLDYDGMVKTYGRYAKDPAQYRVIGTRQFDSVLGNLYNYIFDTSVKPDASNHRPVNPEILEVTGWSDDWFKNLYNMVVEMNTFVVQLDKAIRMKNASLYSKAMDGYTQKYDDIKAFIKKKPTALDPVKHKQITAANRAKRKADFIAQRKVQLMKEDAERLALENEKKASSSRK